MPDSRSRGGGCRCTGPLRYSLDLGISEGALWATGSLAQPVELRCVRCLEPFPFDIEVKAFSIHHELTGPELIDLTPYLREDILLNLPAASALRSRRRPGLSRPQAADRRPPPRPTANARRIGARWIS